MSRFYVGQRVRIVRSSMPFFTDRERNGLTHEVPGMVGKEATIAGTHENPNRGFDASGCWDTSIRLDCGLIGMVPSACLEPATDSYDKTTWDQCVWMPEHLRSTA